MLLYCKLSISLSYISDNFARISLKVVRFLSELVFKKSASSKKSYVQDLSLVFCVDAALIADHNTSQQSSISFRTDVQEIVKFTELYLFRWKNVLNFSSMEQLKITKAIKF